ncbi:hypothetical protein KY345_06185 [Candidatus Woesearchaeota archaeon]|nr:hypothetical protein [Candidatus Woesearchaeota archaeon]
MVTVLDIGLLNYFYVIFPFLFIYAVTLGLLSWLKFFGENKLVHNMVAIVVAFIFVLSDTLVKVVNMAVPWFVIMFVLLMFLLLAYKFLGAKDADIAHVLTRDKTVVVWIMIIFVIILVGSLARVYFSEEAPAPVVGEGGIVVSEEELGKVGVSAFWSTLFNPQVLAVIMVLLIAVFAILLLTGEVPKA